MKVQREDGTLLLSRADHGLFDILVMSREFADAHAALTTIPDSVIIVEVTQEPKDLEEAPDTEEIQDMEELQKDFSADQGGQQ